jgi:SsrA-binding protein
VEAAWRYLGTSEGIREGRVNLRDSYARAERGEIWMMNVHISPYSHAATPSTHEKRQRKLLLHAHEIRS